MKKNLTIAVTGAKGFVGYALINNLLEYTNYNIMAISRSQMRVDIKYEDRFTYVECDLHNLLHIELTLKKADIAIYLVHSMLPSSHWDQGDFADFDLSIADNFGRAASLMGIKQIIYLGGIIPEKTALSRHLASRQEVENTLKKYVATTTCLRASLIFGAESSSFRIIYSLVKKLPLILYPKLLENRCQITYIDDVIYCIKKCILNEECYGRSIDIGGSTSLPYIEVLKKTAKFLNRKNIFVPIGKLPLWMYVVPLALLTRAPRALIRPLLESLKSDTVSSKKNYYDFGSRKFSNTEESLMLTLKDKDRLIKLPHAFMPKRYQQKSVRAIHRLPLVPGKDAIWIARTYMKWLPSVFPWLLNTVVKGQFINFRLKFLPLDLLILRYSPERSQRSRQLFYIWGGVLMSKKNVRGRLEMREMPDGKTILAAVHDFIPRLPWFIYKFSQAKVHAFVMKRYRDYLVQQEIPDA